VRCLALEASRLQRLAAAGFASLALAAGCGADSTGPDGAVGDARIVTSTTGEDLDPEGYTLVANSEEARPIGINDTVEASDLPPGRFVFELEDLASNCGVEGSNPRTLQVRGGELTSTTFEVVCTAREGDLEVAVSTTGDDLDPDGYSVVVDDTRSRAVGPNGEVVFGELEAGPHEVDLEGVASNCDVEGESPRQVEVPGGGTGSTTFEVVCEARAGDVEVRASTTGSFIDPDGYEVVLDGDDSRSLARNGSVTFRDVAAGPHDLLLEDISRRCSVDGANPREVDVPAGGLASTTFEVSCGPGDDDDED
jgi:hypothetical protein